MLDKINMKSPAQSVGVWGGVAAIAGPLLGLLGYSLSPEDAGNMPIYLGMIVSGVGGLTGIFGRVRATKQIG